MVITTVRETVIRDMLFADDAAIASHTEQQLQYLMDHFSHACHVFSMTISKKTTLMGQGIENSPEIKVNDCKQGHPLQQRRLCFSGLNNRCITINTPGAYTWSYEADGWR